jgi:uncharacterized membrane protein
LTSSPGTADRRALVLCLAYVAATFAWFCVWNHTMAERSVDEAYLENILWNATHGNGLRTLVEGAGGRGLPHLALHFTPFLYLLVPLYALFPSMHVVHLLISAGVAAAGLVFYRLAKEKLDPTTSLVLMGAFLLHPTVVLQTFMEAHDQAFAFLPLMVLVVGYERGSLVTSLIGGLFFVAIREENALLVLVLGVLALLVKRRVALGLALLTLAIGWLALYRWLGVAVLAQGHVSHLFAGTYGNWGETPAEMLRALLANPVAAVRHVLAPRGLSYLAQLLAPFFVVLGFGNPIVLAALPQVFLILLAKHATRMFEIRRHYSVAPVTLLFVGAIGTLAFCGAREITLGRRRVRIARLLALALLAASLAGVPVWMTRAIGRLNPHADEVRALIATIPDTASVTAPDYILNHMAKRRHIAKTWAGPLNTTEYLILEDPSRLHFQGVPEDTPYTPANAARVEADGYVRIYAHDGLYAWRRGP